MVQVQLAVEPRLHVVSYGHEANAVPLAERRSFHGGRRELPPASVVGVEPEVVLERIRADDVVLAVGEPEHDATRCVLPAGDRLELHRDIDVAVRPARRHDDVELVLRRSLHQHLLAAGRPRHLLHGPLSVDRRPALDPLGLEVESCYRKVVRHLDLRHAPEGGRATCHAIRADRGQRCPEQATS